MQENIPDELISIGDFLKDFKEAVLDRHYLDIDEPADDNEDHFDDAGDQKDDSGAGFISGDHTDEGEEPEDSDDSVASGSRKSFEEADDASSDTDHWGADGKPGTKDDEVLPAYVPTKAETEAYERKVVEQQKERSEATEKEQSDQDKKEYADSVAYDPAGVKIEISGAITPPYKALAKTQAEEANPDEQPGGRSQDPNNWSTEMKENPPRAESIEDKVNPPEPTLTVPLVSGQSKTGTPTQLSKDASDLELEGADDISEASTKDEFGELIHTPEEIAALQESSLDNFDSARVIRLALAEFYASRTPDDEDFEEDLERLMGNMEALGSSFDMVVE